MKMITVNKLDKLIIIIIILIIIKCTCTVCVYKIIIPTIMNHSELEIYKI